MYMYISCASEAVKPINIHGTFYSLFLRFWSPGYLLDIKPLPSTGKTNNSFISCFHLLYIHFFS